jgi:hypothetical protein
VRGHPPPVRQSRRALPVVLVLTLLAGAALAPAAASPQPTPVCPACGAQFEQAADGRGVDVTVRESTALVRIHENGSATWTVRNQLNSTDEFSEDPATLDTIARRLVEDGYGPPDDAVLRGARIEADEVVVVFHDPDTAERHAGLLVVDHLHDRGIEMRYRVNADRFTVRGPVGTVVTNEPSGALVDGRSATWTGSAGGPVYRAPDLEGSPYVVFGPDSTGGLRTGAAVALATLPIVTGAVQQFVLGPTLLFAVVLGGVGYGVRRHDITWSTAAFGYALVAVGAALAATLAVVYGIVEVPGLALFAAGLGAAAGTAQVRDRAWSPGRLAAAAAAGLAGTLLLLVGLYAAIGTERPLGAAVRSTAPALPLAVMLPFGAALAGDTRGATAWGLLTVLAFVVVPGVLVDLTDPPGGLGGGVITLFLFGLALAAPVVGALVIAMGRTLVDEGDDRAGADRLDGG